MLHQLETIHIIYLFRAGEYGEKEARGQWPLKFKNVKNVPSNITKMPTSYIIFI